MGQYKSGVGQKVELMKYKFGDLVKYGEQRGVIIQGKKARKYTYYLVVFDYPYLTSNDWLDNLVEYTEIREDFLEDYES